jgi:peptidyl-prolyl cis-trans isomerase SurA
LGKIINGNNLVIIMMRKMFSFLLGPISLLAMTAAYPYLVDPSLVQPPVKHTVRHTHKIAAKKNPVSSSGVESLDGIVAVVNDSPVTTSELNAAIATIEKQMRGSGTALPPEAILRKQVLDQVINRKLQLELAAQGGIKITDEEVNKAIGTIAAQNKVGMHELMEKVVQSGMTEVDYRKEIREEMTLQAVQQSQVSSHITISPSEVDEFMRSAAWKAFNNKEYHLEDILLTMPEAPTPQDLAAGKKKADAIIEKLHSGMSFKDVAMAQSDSSGALQGGDLGWRKLPQIPSAFADQLVHMKTNDIIGPVLTPNGYHIVRLAGMRETHSNATQDALHKQVQQLIFQRKYEEELQSWLTRVRSEAFINMHPEKV